MSKLDIEWLGVFVVIHRTRSVSLAVQRLGMAQARASGILAKLRRPLRHFYICMTDISEVVVLPSLVNELRRVAPGITVEAERIWVESPRRLESGELDLAVGYLPDLEAGFYQQTLFRQGFVCLAAKRHPRIRERMTREQFSANDTSETSSPFQARIQTSPGR